MEKRRGITIENARLAFRNFSGKEGQFNPAGRRNFCVFLEPDQAEGLRREGWNVRMLTPREDGDLPQDYMQVAVSYANIPPKIILITEKGKTVLDENSINLLDWAEIDTADLVITPYEWEVRGKKGVKAYLKTAYITLVEDEFAKKYRDVPDSAASALEDDAEPDRI